MTEFDKVIPPGGVGKITASLDTSHYKGPIAKSVQVTTNDPGKRQFTLQLKVDIVTVIDVTPTEAPAFQLKVGEKPPVQELTVAASDGNAFDILTVRADPSVAVTVRPAAGAPAPATAKKRQDGPVGHGSNRYLVAITPTREAPIGRSIANVTLTTNRPKAETIPLRAFLLVAGPLQVNPEQLFVRPGPEAPVLHVKISKAAGTDLKILYVESTDPEFAATVTPVAKGREYDLAVRYTGKLGRGAVGARITVKTNEPTQNAIVIPLTGRI